jgi:uncharacterized membrane-anchored protein
VITDSESTGSFPLPRRNPLFQTINTRRREAFYWASVVATFALGTALGDLAAGSAGWASSLPACCSPASSCRAPVGRLGSLAAFWAAYVIARPLGASFADWMAVPARHGGLGLGTGIVTAAWSLAIVGVLTFMALSRTNRRDEVCTAAT